MDFAGLVEDLSVHVHCLPIIFIKSKYDVIKAVKVKIYKQDAVMNHSLITLIFGS